LRIDWDVVFVQVAEGIKGALHLRDVRQAAPAAPEMSLETRPLDPGERVLKVVSDELDELAAGHSIG
jgi:hypothetical protein